MMTLPSLLIRLHGESDDARFEAWKQLYHSTDSAYEAELEKILSCENPVLCVWFARFLANVSEKRAIVYLASLLSSVNASVSEAARKAFEKNHYQKKAIELLPVLAAKTDAARLYAIEKLAAGSITEALPALINHLNKGPLTEQPKVLSALRYLPDKRLLADLKIFSTCENADLRFRTVLVFAAILDMDIRAAHAPILSFLEDTDARVRQAATWSLARQARQFDQSLFLKLIKSDPDPLVRQEAVQGLAQFSSNHTVKTLIETLVLDRAHMVALRAEACLLSFPAKPLLRGLKILLHHNNLSVARKALYLLAASEHKSASFFKRLCKGLAKAKKDSEKLSYIEALGIFGEKKAMPLLNDFLKASPVLAYGALAAILQINDRAPDFPYHLYLNDPDLSDILKQMIIKHYLKNEEAKEAISSEYFLAQLEHKNLNLRYLSALALTKRPGEPIIEPLLKLVLKENNTLLKKFLSQSLLQILAKTPLLLKPLLLVFQFNANAIQQLLTLAHQLTLTVTDAKDLLKAFLSPEYDFLITDHLSFLSRFISKQLVTQQLALDELILYCRFHQDAKHILSATTVELKHFPQALIHSDPKVFLDELFVHKQLDAATIVKLMTFSSGPDMAKALVTILAHSEFQACHKLASQGLLRTLELSP
jgi:HEAT repeat protein